MTAPYKYRSKPWTKVCTSEDWTAAALDLLGGKAGITGEFKYSTLGIHILTGILAKASKMAPVDFANQYLFEPLGIARHENYYAQTEEEHKEFTLSKEPRKQVWSCGLNNLTNLDLGKVPTLRVLECQGNQFTSLDIRKLPALEKLWCQGNPLEFVDVQNHANLKQLLVGVNTIYAYGCPNLDTSEGAMSALEFFAGTDVVNIIYDKVDLNY